MLKAYVFYMGIHQLITSMHMRLLLLAQIYRLATA